MAKPLTEMSLCHMMPGINCFISCHQWRKITFMKSERKTAVKLSGPRPVGVSVGVAQRFRGQVGPILELLKCYFFPLQIIFIDSYMTSTTYKLTLIALCTLQASCSHAASQAEIQPLVWNHTSPIEKFQINFFKSPLLFFALARHKTKTVLKR